jgi:hypothetical protein
VGKPFARVAAPLRRALGLDGAAVEAAGRRVVRVELAGPRGDLPEILAGDEFAVVKERPPEGWPVGSGPLRPRDGTAGRPVEIACVPNRHHPLAPPGDVAVLFRPRPGSDPRDLLGGDVDALVVRGREEIGYGSTLPGFTDRALPFDRNYLLLRPDPGFPAEGWAPDREELARHVAPGDARAIEKLRFDRDCPVPTGAGPATGGSRSLRVVFPAGDDDARSIAERFTALWRSGGASEAVNAAGLPSPAFAEALRRGRDAAYVYPLYMNHVSGCARLGALIAAAPWLAEGIGGEPVRAGRPVEDGRLLPLIRTRPHLLAGPGFGGAFLDGSGTAIFRSGAAGEATP